VAGNAALGRQVLKEWHDAASRFATNFNMPFDELADYLTSLDAQFFDNLGDAAFYAAKNVGQEAIYQNMRDLAEASQGLVSTYPDGTPRSSYWLNSLVKVSQASLTNLAFVEHVAPQIAADTLKESAAVVGGLAVGGLAIYLLGAGLAIGVLMYFQASSVKGKIAAHRKAAGDWLGGSS
jgi:hypothetical protein